MERLLRSESVTIIGRMETERKSHIEKRGKSLELLEKVVKWAEVEMDSKEESVKLLEDFSRSILGDQILIDSRTDTDRDLIEACVQKTKPIPSILVQLHDELRGILLFLAVGRNARLELPV